MSSTQRRGGSGGLSISMLSSSGREEGEAGEWKMVGLGGICMCVVVVVAEGGKMLVPGFRYITPC